jgi:ABC-type branched-subunit amino acid transport system ATPase component
VSTLELRNVEVAYGGVAAVRGISLSVEPGEIVIINQDGLRSIKAFGSGGQAFRPHCGKIHGTSCTLNAARVLHLVMTGW